MVKEGQKKYGFSSPKLEDKNNSGSGLKAGDQRDLKETHCYKVPLFLGVFWSSDDLLNQEQDVFLKYHIDRKQKRLHAEEGICRYGDRKQVKTA